MDPDAAVDLHIVIANIAARCCTAKCSTTAVMEATDPTYVMLPPQLQRRFSDGYSSASWKAILVQPAAWGKGGGIAAADFAMRSSPLALRGIVTYCRESAGGPVPPPPPPDAIQASPVTGQRGSTCRRRRCSSSSMRRATGSPMVVYGCSAGLCGGCSVQHPAPGPEATTMSHKYPHNTLITNLPGTTTIYHYYPFCRTCATYFSATYFSATYFSATFYSLHIAGPPL